MFRRRLTVTALVPMLFLSSAVFAAEVSLEKARPVAQNWLKSALSAQKKVTDKAQYQIVKEETIQDNGKTIGYNFILSPAGHIIVPARDELPAVKLYSTTTSLSMNENSDAAKWIKQVLLDVNQELDTHSVALAGVDQTSTHNAKLWAKMASEATALAPSDSPTEPSVTYGPLLTTTWDQGSPYNLQTPLWYNGDPTVTGCTATSGAQILKYWNWPPTGQGSYSYTWNNGSTNVTLSANFAASTYDWANMLNTYTGSETTAQKNAVAKLMSDVGIAFQMSYGRAIDGGSGAWVQGNEWVYPTYFKYQNTTQTVARTSYASDSDWMQLFKEETSHSRPSHMQIGTTAPPYAGHAIVVDGYSNVPSEQVHLNLGWSGSYDGWYVTNNIVAGGYTFNDMSYMKAIIGIQPATTVNQAPVVYAGPDQTVLFPAAANLAGTVTDDGLPNPPATVTISWSKVSGPGTVTFANPSSPVTTATFSSAGTYVLRLTGNDSALAATDDVTITVSNPSPCAGLCTNPVQFSIAQYRDYQSGNLGAGAVCYETTSNVVGGNCGNFVSPRTLSVNGTQKTCNYQNWSSVPAKRNGGYCIQTTAGSYPWAYFSVWRGAQ